MMATRVLNQLTVLAQDGGIVIVSLHQPSADAMRLALDILEAVPLAWRPYHCQPGGYFRAEVVLPSKRTATWVVHDVAEPPGWQALDVRDERLSTAWLNAGVELCRLADVQMRDAAEVFARQMRGGLVAN